MIGSPGRALHEIAAGRIRGAAGAVLALSRRIHAHPETAFDEHAAAAWCVEELERHGVPGHTGAFGLPTAFVAEAGHGPCVVAICCEYDALPGIGHACGHNIIAAAGVGAAIGLAAVADAAGLTVRVLGTPAEESGGGKVMLLERGAFDGVDGALMAHPGCLDGGWFRSYARSTLSFTYTGRAAHASAAPHHARSAADALTLAQVGVGLLCQHLPPTARIHGAPSHSGDGVPNVVPAASGGTYQVRAADAAGLRELTSRVTDCLRAAALATGCEVEIGRPEPDYLEFAAHPALAARADAHLRALGRRPVPIAPAASTDMGNVSHAVPSLHLVIDVGAGRIYPHQPEFAGHCVTPAADRAVIDAAVCLAWTAIDLAVTSRPPEG
ncbi:amidohydrolase [Microbispora sp. NPDC088329]|uniref:amidohydrolase n=1 Tax=unclassified Microbispora TaxID=2614687 RepID=UPI0034334C89